MSVEQNHYIFNLEQDVMSFITWAPPVINAMHSGSETQFTNYNRRLALTTGVLHQGNVTQNENILNDVIKKND